MDTLDERVFYDSIKRMKILACAWAKKYNHEHDALGHFGSGGESKTPMEEHLHGPDTSIAEYDKKAAPQIAKFAAQHGMTPKEYTQAVDAKAKELIKGTRIWSLTSQSSLGKILSAGRMKTQFDEGVKPSEGSTKIQTIRREAEDTLFGYSQYGTDAIDRPIYGYVTKDGMGVGMVQSHAEAFGDVAIQFKGVGKRTSITMGDSMNASESLLPSPFLNPNHRSFNLTHSWSKDPLVEAHIPKNEDTPGNSSMPYLEAQIHRDNESNAISTKDISGVVFHMNEISKQPSEALLKKLNKLDIPYRIVQSRNKEYARPKIKSTIRPKIVAGVAMQKILYVNGDIGSGEERYLVSSGTQSTDLGEVLDIGNKTLSAGLPIITLLGQGYWDEYTGKQNILPDLLEFIKK